MGHLIGTLAALVILTAPANAPEIKSTTKLTIIADGVGMIEITTPDVLALSHVFAGNFIGAPADIPNPNLARLTVIFDIQTIDGVKRGAYVVQYVFDESTGEAFIYLPGRGDAAFRRNASTILRDGQDGHWHRAAAEWATAIRVHVR